MEINKCWYFRIRGNEVRSKKSRGEDLKRSHSKDWNGKNRYTEEDNGRSVVRQWDNGASNELRVYQKARIQVKKTGKTYASEKCGWLV